LRCNYHPEIPKFSGKTGRILEMIRVRQRILQNNYFCCSVTPPFGVLLHCFNFTHSKGALSMVARMLGVRNAILCSALIAFSSSAFAAMPYGGGVPMPGPNVAAMPYGGGVPMPGPNVAAMPYGGGVPMPGPNVAAMPYGGGVPMPGPNVAAMPYGGGVPMPGPNVA
jgi:hypothetical protein